MRKFIVGLILLNILIWGWTIAHADNYADLTWEAPTTSLTGERDAQGNCITVPIPATGPEALAGFRIVYNTSIEALALPPPDSDCSKTSHPDPTGVVVNINDPTARSARIQPLTNGTYYFLIAAINQAGAISYFTGPVSKTITVNPVLSTTAPQVYNVVKKTNGFVLVVVGTVPLNTPCIVSQSVNGYYAVPTSAVTWTGVKSVVVVAQCSVQ
jgi:hypothetical protein